MKRKLIFDSGKVVHIDFKGEGKIKIKPKKKDKGAFMSIKLED